MTKPRKEMWTLSPPAIALIALAVFALIVPSATATLVLSDVSFSPNPPLVPAQPQHVTANFAIIPSGATTFASGHNIQLQTDLVNAQWNIRVMLDGLPAAQQSVTGSVAFINGALISYPTSRDVSLIISIDGTVPANAGVFVMVMQAEEIDNSGGIVPGSVITINQPTTLSTVSPVSPTIPPLTPVITTPPAPSPTRAPGFSFVGGILALCIVGAVVTGRRFHSHGFL